MSNDFPFDDEETSEAPFPKAQPNHELPSAVPDEELAERRRLLNARQVGELTALRQRQAEEREASGLGGDEPVKTFAPVNINIDLGELMAYFGMEYDEDGPTGAPNRDIRQQILSMVSDKMVKQIMGSDSDFKKRLGDSINDALGDIIVDALMRQFQPVDWSGQPKGEPTTLTEIIGAQAKQFLAEALAEPGRYDSDRGGHKGKLKKFVSEEVGRKFEGELKVAADEAKKIVVKAVTDKGAEFLGQAFADAAAKVQAATPTKVIGGGEPTKGRDF